MKNKSLAILFMGVFLLAFSTCKKDTDPNVETFKIVKEVEKVMVGTTTATITGAYEYSGKINSIKVRVGTSEQLFGSDVYVAEVSGKAYSVNITDLHSGTLYHYRYEVDYGSKEDYLTEIDDFTTQSESPTVKTLEVLALDSTTFRVKCEVVADGGSEVSERGICWNTYGDPILDDEVLPYANGGIGQFALRLENLSMSTKYYVRAYAKNATGIGFGEVMEFRTGSETTLPVVSTIEVNEVTSSTAICLGNVSSNGGLDLMERGVCWSMNGTPTLSDSHAAADEATLGQLRVTMTGLTPNRTYHVRAYATNAKGTAYGEELTFTTTEGLPVVTTAAITNITSTSATGGGIVTDQGASTVTERGICWSTSHNPNINDSHSNSGMGMGSYTVQMTSLVPNKTYYVKAYATNAQGTSYGAEVEFTAKEGLPVVQTLEVTHVTSTSAKVRGKVTEQGSSAVTERGVCWGTEPSPTAGGSHLSGGTGTGEYTIEITGLTTGTKYYVRTYAVNAQGMTYGEQLDFTTEANLPEVVTGNINGTTVSGTVTDDGGATVTERGICWSTHHNPTTADTHASSGSGVGSYSVELTNLAPGTKYYVCAYAINSQGTAYGIEKDLTTEASLPTVTTGEVTNITQNQALGSGNVTDEGGATVTERGLCWSTSHNPTILCPHSASGTGLGSFTVEMKNLTANTVYYVRAYAKNSKGYAYGSEQSFTTSQNTSAPTVTTAQVTNVTQNSAIGGGNVTADGGATVTERGICWSTNHNPTTSGSHASSGTGVGSFTVNMTGLAQGTTYYVRAYAINSQGTSYGSEVSFTTQQSTTVPTVTTSQVTNITQNSATGGGNVTSSGGATVTERGICWSINHNPTTSGNHATSGTGLGYYEVNMTSLTANTTYYVRAYAKNSAGTAYGNEMSFTTEQEVTLPTVTTSQVTNITHNSATGGGNVTSSGGATVTERGICWSTNHNPTLNNSHASSGTGIGSFTVNINSLTAATTYYVRAYAINSQGTSYGSEVSFTTSVPPQPPTGAINGLFSVSPTQQVWFSQGNLQYQASTNTWRFATNQYDYIGNDNSNISQTYSGWIDMFGWGTSGYHDPSDPYNVNYQPWSTATDVVSLEYNKYGYGPSTNMASSNLTDSSANYDWGVYNAISNGGNLAGQWRTLTGTNSGEWYYVINTRSTTSGIRYAKAEVAGVCGMILLPDNWSSDTYSLNNTNQGNAPFYSNIITATQWTTLQDAGAVFLPAAGYRENGHTILSVNSGGLYWSAMYSNSICAYLMRFWNSGYSPQYSGYDRSHGFSVRLVHAVQ